MSAHEFVWDGRNGGGENARYCIVAGRAADDNRLGRLHLRILLHAGRFNQQKGWCRLSQKELAEKFDCRRQGINEAVRDLVEWLYLEKRDQAEAGESFCLYRILVDAADSGGVSEKPDTGGVSEKPDTRVRSRRTRESATPDTPRKRGIATRARLDQSDHIEHGKPKAPDYLGERGGDPIPFDDVIDRDAPLPSDSRTAPEILAEGKRRAAVTKAPRKRLVCSPSARVAIRKLRLDPDAIETRYLAKAEERTGPPIADPSAYMVRMAQLEAADRDGITVERVVAMTTKGAKGIAATLAGETLSELTDRLARRPRKSGDETWRDQARQRLRRGAPQ
jgi:hypothetical protein